MAFYHGVAVAPAIKTCEHCQKPKIDMRKRSTFGIAETGHLVCRRCWQKEISAMGATPALEA